jgi:hypothetical protein
MLSVVFFYTSHKPVNAVSAFSEIFPTDADGDTSFQTFSRLFAVPEFCTMKSYSLFISASLFTLIAGCSDQPAALPSTPLSETINTTCPIMGGEVSPEIVVSWNNKKVGFCCPPCIEQWNELSDDEKTAKLTASASHGHDGHSSTPPK